MNNLFISYDLNSPNQNYDVVIESIKELGNWAYINKSTWYVSSLLSAEEAAKKIHLKMDSNDNLIVINTSNNEAYWYNLSDEVSNHIQEFWYK
ncbi:hypothetical protein [Arcobacter sp.]|uniref:hypothetical protein n=1 Tax=Arcobacter sp. TaxID=1872629 RepID=UPI003D144AC3